MDAHCRMALAPVPLKLQTITNLIIILSKLKDILPFRPNASAAL